MTLPLFVGDSILHISGAPQYEVPYMCATIPSGLPNLIQMETVGLVVVSHSSPVPSGVTDVDTSDEFIRTMQEIICMCNRVAEMTRVTVIGAIATTRFGLSPVFLRNGRQHQVGVRTVKSLLKKGMPENIPPITRRMPVMWNLYQQVSVKILHDPVKVIVLNTYPLSYRQLKPDLNEADTLSVYFPLDDCVWAKSQAEAALAANPGASIVLLGETRNIGTMWRILEQSPQFKTLEGNNQRVRYYSP